MFCILIQYRIGLSRLLLPFDQFVSQLHQCLTRLPLWVSFAETA